MLGPVNCFSNNQESLIKFLALRSLDYRYRNKINQKKKLLYVLFSRFSSNDRGPRVANINLMFDKFVYVYILKIKSNLLSSNDSNKLPSLHIPPFLKTTVSSFVQYVWGVKYPGRKLTLLPNSSIAVGRTSWASTLFTLEFLVTLFSADFVHLTMAFVSTHVQQTLLLCPKNNVLHHCLATCLKQSF